MTDKVSLTIDITLEERQRIENRARQHGFDTPTDYLLSLVEDDEPTKEELLAELRESIREAESGQIIPASEFLTVLEATDVK
jgi:hypothetical protein